MRRGKEKGKVQTRERQQPVEQAELTEKEQKKERNEKLENYRKCRFAIVMFVTSNSIAYKKFKNLGT